ncbi:unnamed protein product [Cercospora beticola]|nr:unnamed protein product [Cercospora beticola]
MALTLSTTQSLTPQTPPAETKAPKTIYDISISLRNDGPDGISNHTYHPEDLISGSIHAQYVNAVELVHVAVTLEGTMRTWVDHEYYASAARYDFLKQSQNIPRSERIPQQDANERRCIMPFKFRIAPQCLPNQDLSPHLSGLPPSFKAGPTSRDQHGNQCMQPLIEYCIAVTIFYRSGTGPRLRQIRRSRTIDFSPLTEPEPPISVEDFPGEFKLTSTEEARKGLFRTVCGDVTVSSSEFRPLPMFYDGKPGHTQGMVTLTLATLRLTNAEIQPPRWTCEVQMALIRRTFYTTMPIREVACSRLLKKNKYLRLRKETIYETTWSVDPLWWEHTHTRPDAPGIVSEATIPMPVRPPTQLIPTFATPLATVRYAVRVDIRIAQVTHPPLVIEVPLQVYHSRRIHGDGNGFRDSVSTVGPVDSALPPSYYL